MRKKIYNGSLGVQKGAAGILRWEWPKGGQAPQRRDRCRGLGELAQVGYKGRLYGMFLSFFKLTAPPSIILDGTEKDGTLSSFSSPRRIPRGGETGKSHVLNLGTREGIPFSSLGCRGSVAFPVNGTLPSKLLTAVS